MGNKILRLIRKRTFVYALLILACLLNGIIQTVVTFDANLGMGDNSTFYAFTRNVANGEVMYDDFIHFRTPGTITLFAGLMQVLGQEQSTLEISTRIETLVLYPLIFLLSAMVLFRKQSPVYLVIAFMGIALLPGVAQLRAAFGLLAIAVYSLSFDFKRHRNYILLATGFLSAVTFIFGQEVFLMVMLCVAAGEIYSWVQGNGILQRLKYLTIGIAAGIVPLLFYMAVFSNLANFLYYTTYYSFVLQPQFMNLPFPELSYSTIFNYLPFAMYWLCFVVLYTNRKLGVVEGLLLSFGILRLITAVGRSDFGHFLFAIPEVFLIVPYLLTRARGSDLRPAVLMQFLPYGLALAVLLALSTNEGIALAPVPFLILLALHMRSKQVVPKINIQLGSLASYNLFALTAALFILFVYMLAPTYASVARDVKAEIFVDDSKAYRVGGVKTDEVNYRQIQAVKAAVEPINPKTVFAFPIQPFYYSLADEHASRFLTFEPQTTVEEQNQTIEDLLRTKPEVIIFDPLQAHGLSGSLWKISNHIMGHYRVDTEVVMRENLWVMTPKLQPSREDKLVFQLYHDNSGITAKADASGIQSSSQGLYNAIQQNNKQVQFKVDASKGATLRVSLRDEFGNVPEGSLCGVVKALSSESIIKELSVCAGHDMSTINIPASKKPVTIQLHNPNSRPVIWNDPTVSDGISTAGGL